MVHDLGILSTQPYTGTPLMVRQEWPGAGELVEHTKHDTIQVLRAGGEAVFATEPKTLSYEDADSAPSLETEFDIGPAGKVGHSIGAKPGNLVCVPENSRAEQPVGRDAVMEGDQNLAVEIEIVEARGTGTYQTSSQSVIA